MWSELRAANVKARTNSKKSDERGTEFWPPFYDYRLKVSDTLLVFVTFLLFAATIALWWATRRLVAGAENTAIQQLRAYISATPVYGKIIIAKPIGDSRINNQTRN
jgi:hypothetical protein